MLLKTVSLKSSVEKTPVGKLKIQLRKGSDYLKMLDRE